MSVVAPALSSTSRRKSHYRGKEIRKREKGVDAFACNQVRLLLAGFGYLGHARPARRAGARDRHRLEPAAPCRTRAPHPGALHRLGPPDHDDHRRRFGALAHARPRACDPARRALRIARPHRRADPSPGPGGPQGRRGVSKRRRQARASPKTTPLGLETPVFDPRNRPHLPSREKTAGCERSLSPLPLPSTRQFMNKVG